MTGAETGKILYIHGFGSCGDSNKTRQLKSYFGADNVISPDMPVDPQSTMAFLEKVIASGQVALLIGSSLGGYYADWLAQEHGLPAVLINPSTRPFETLEPHVGMNRRWCDGTPFEWKAEYLRTLEQFVVELPRKEVPRLVLLQSGDEVLDYRLAAEKYKAFDVVIEEGGNHRFENLDAYLGQITAFYRSQELASQ